MSGDPPQPAPVDSPPRPITENLYCLNCAYNLRGLAGDPVRCPECGEWNPLGKAEIPAPLVAKQLHRMEWIAAASVVLGPTALVLSVIFVRRAIPLIRAESMDSFGRLCIALAWAWLGEIGFIGAFRQQCLAKPGWRGVLVAYHAIAFAVLALISGTIALGSWLAWRGLSSRGLAGIILVLALIVATLVLLYAIRRVGAHAHRRLIQRMHALQRDVAIELIRESLDQRLRTPRGRR